MRWNAHFRMGRILTAEQTARARVEAARALGLQTMIGCMIESSVLITAGAHLAELADHLDLDGNVLIRNDPYRGVRNHGGHLSFAGLENKPGLGIASA